MHCYLLNTLYSIFIIYYIDTTMEIETNSSASNISYKYKSLILEEEAIYEKTIPISHETNYLIVRFTVCKMVDGILIIKK